MKEKITKEDILRALIISTTSKIRKNHGVLNVNLEKESGQVDYITMDDKDIFRCYEIRTEDDFSLKEKMYFVGNYNFLVLSEDIYEKLKKNIERGFYGVGIYTYNGYTLKLIRRATLKTVHLSEKVHLMQCMIHTLSRYTIEEAEI